MSLKVILFYLYIIYICETQSEFVKNEIQNNTDVILYETNVITKTQNTINDVKIAHEVKPKKIKRPKKRRRNSLLQNVEIGLIKNSTVFVNTSVTETGRKRRKKRRRKKKLKQNKMIEVSNTTTINETNLSEQINENLQVLKNKTTIRESKIFLKNFRQDNYTKQNMKTNSFNSTILLQKRNRCRINNGGCSQICKRKGKTKCACLEGYVLAKNRKKCVDLDECRIRNGGCKEICQNTLGSYFCDCSWGFRIAEDSKSCQDINECHLRNGHGPCQDTCTNTHGSYTCDCSHLNGTVLSLDQHTCENINGCEEVNPGCSHLCISTRIGGFCSCPDGMELMSDYKTCQDIDECEDASIKQTCLRGCVNTVGSFYCEEDFQNDGYVNKTRVPSCPPLDLPPYGFITCLRNNSLPYDTFTKNGRKVIKNSPGTKCFLECPIGFRLLGEGRYICGISGKWIVKKKGLCIKSPYPKLRCPNDQTFSLKKGHETVLVNFPPPETNIRWKIVKSYPEWAKNLKGELGEGHHSVQFSVTDPASKLSSTCSFSVIIKK